MSDDIVLTSVTSHATPMVGEPSNEESARKTRYGFQFWAIFAGLSLTALMSALDGSIVPTALPTIARDLEAGNNYVWIINIYFLTR